MSRRVDWRAPEGGRVVLYGSVFGLAAEERAVGQLWSGGGPYDRVLLGISAEALTAIGAQDGAPPEVPPEAVPPVTQLYMEQLGRFGPTRMPAPDLYAAWRAAKEEGVPVEPIDLSDAEHTEVYVKNVSVWENIRKERRQVKRAAQMETIDDLARFVKAWDTVFFPTRGLRRVEEAREAHMAQKVHAAARTAQRVLAVVPRERMDGILEHLEAGQATL